MEDDTLRCSFCRQSPRAVKKLIAGPDVYICDNCIRECQEILDEELTPNEGPEHQANRMRALAQQKREEALLQRTQAQPHLDRWHALRAEADRLDAQADELGGVDAPD